MRILLSFLVLISPLSAAVISVCASGCTFNNTQLQTALNAATCGDTVQLQAGVTYTGNFTMTSNCAANNPPVVTGSLMASLPVAGQTVTRAYYYGGLFPI